MSSECAGKCIVDSLVQQPMRTPSTASVNVIMKEDMAASADVAKYKGIEDRCLVH